MTEVGQHSVAIAVVPAVLHFIGSPQAAAERGSVLFYHGFGGAKDRVAGYATALAEAGFLAVYPDAVGHGDRRYADFEVIFSDERWDTDFEATETDFLQLIDDTAAEVPSIIDDLIARGWAGPYRIGIGGRSLGGNISYAAVVADSRIGAMASVVGSPEWTLPRSHSPHHHPDRFFPAAVLSQSAELDEFVPSQPIHDFHDSLTPFYAEEPTRIAYVQYPGVGHFLTAELNTDSQRRVVTWFQKWLAAGHRANRLE
jgi:dienelactone hydrolase